MDAQDVVPLCKVEGTAKAGWTRVVLVHRNEHTRKELFRGFSNAGCKPHVVPAPAGWLEDELVLWLHQFNQ